MTHHCDPQPVTDQVVQTVADAEGVAHTELTPLGEIIDPDALNQLFSLPSETPKEVQFEYEEYNVVIEEDHTIRLE